jgi:hypothetical protein
MEWKYILERCALSGGKAVTPAKADYALNVATFYRDTRTRKWAEGVCGLVTQLTGSEWIRTRSWMLGNLTQPQVFPCAVQAAATADIIIVSVYATDQLLLDFYSWINEWLPQRRQAPGTLVALIGAPDHLDFAAPPIEEYLQAVARKGHLDFLPHKRKFPAGAADSCLEEPAGDPTPRREFSTRFSAKATGTFSAHDRSHLQRPIQTTTL